MKVAEYSKKRGEETQAAQALKVIMGTDDVDIRTIPAYRDAIEVAAESYADDVALQYPFLYPVWAAGVAYEVDKHVRGTNGKLYKCIQAHTSQADWSPEAVASLWTRVDVAHDGTADDPIPYDGNMALTRGLYYIQDWVIYKCTRDTGNPVYHALSELVGLYVEKA